MHKMAMWAREQMIASHSGFLDTGYASTEGIIYQGENPLRLFSELCIVEGCTESDTFDMVGRVSIGIGRSCHLGTHF